MIKPVSQSCNELFIVEYVTISEKSLTFRICCRRGSGFRESCYWDCRDGWRRGSGRRGGGRRLLRRWSRNI